MIEVAADHLDDLDSDGAEAFSTLQVVLVLVDVTVPSAGELARDTAVGVEQVRDADESPVEIEHLTVDERGRPAGVGGPTPAGSQPRVEIAHAHWPHGSTRSRRRMSRYQ